MWQDPLWRIVVLVFGFTVADSAKHYVHEQPVPVIEVASTFLGIDR